MPQSWSKRADLSKGLSAVRDMFRTAEVDEDRDKVVGALLRSCLAFFPASAAALLLRGRPSVRSFLTRECYSNGPGTTSCETLRETGGLNRRALEASEPFSLEVGEEGVSFDPALDGIPGLPTPRQILCAPVGEVSRVLGSLMLFFESSVSSPEAVLKALVRLAATGRQALHQQSSFERLRRLSTTDDLTGAYNYRYLLDGLRREIRRATRFEQVFSVIMLDVDHLKEYNDLHGHLAGSRLLAAFSQIVQRQLRAVDTMAKYGGDEFVVILPQTEKGGARVVAERIRRAIEAHAFPGEARKITTSLGISSFPADGNQVETLLARADEALYEAKKGGRNRVCVVGEDSPAPPRPHTEGKSD